MCGEAMKLWGYKTVESESELQTFRWDWILFYFPCESLPRIWSLRRTHIITYTQLTYHATVRLLIRTVPVNQIYSLNDLYQKNNTTCVLHFYFLTRIKLSVFLLSVLSWSWKPSSLEVYYLQPAWSRMQYSDITCWTALEISLAPPFVRPDKIFFVPQRHCFLLYKKPLFIGGHSYFLR